MCRVLHKSLFPRLALTIFFPPVTSLLTRNPKKCAEYCLSSVPSSISYRYLITFFLSCCFPISLIYTSYCHFPPLPSSLRIRTVSLPLFIPFSIPSSPSLVSHPLYLSNLSSFISQYPRNGALGFLVRVRSRLSFVCGCFSCPFLNKPSKFLSSRHFFFLF